MTTDESIGEPYDYEPTQCLMCGYGLEEREWIRNFPDHEGNPKEETGTALYCKNDKCPNHDEPIL